MASGVLDLASEWRLQRFGRRGGHQIEDAIVEPLWDGPRVFVAIEDGTATAYHEGTRLKGPGEVLTELGAAALAGAMVVEGHLTEQALRTGEGAPLDAMEKPPGMMSRLFGGLAGGGRRDKLIERQETAALAAQRAIAIAEGSAGTLAFVATDLLWVDGESLLDVPLLERKRLLESVLGESTLVRRSTYVRPSAKGSLLGWKALGFTMLAYKSANSRYRPGEPNDGWAAVPVSRGATAAPRP